MTSRPRVGKHVLETLTMGMYNNPLDALREYIQNSCDAIEEAVRAGVLTDAREGRIGVELDGRGRTITIRDNGIGLRPQSARAALRDVGRSEKLGSQSRGFRGIGRLGGLAYCEQLVFQTKRHDDISFYMQVWDCKKLHRLLSPNDSSDLDMVEVIEEVCSDSSGEHKGHKLDHFFEVRMVGVQEDRLMDLDAVRLHLAQTVPVPFDYERFRCGKELHEHLVASVPDYTTFHITLNNDVLYKPYRDSVPLSRGPGRASNSEHERVRGMQHITLTDTRGNPLACGWVGETDLMGMVSSDCGMAGVRLRSGNMLVGNGRALEDAFQKSNKRFAHYLVGEIHVTHRGLVPNARRDDFEATEVRSALFSAIAREIGEPWSEAIRQASTNRSKVKRLKEIDQVRQQAERMMDKGLVAEGKRAELVQQLEQAKDKLDPRNPRHEQQVRLIEATTEKVESEALHVVDQELDGRLSKRVRDLIKLICEMIYEDYGDDARAEKLIRRIVKKLAAV